ncbi:fimbrial subunit type 1 [Burkholderia latens]|nr:fimbrial subunit type 1 [Burkholderia latens]
MAYTATFNISYSIVLLRKGSAPQTGKADIANYAIFQMDGDGGANENPYRNFRRLINGSVKFTRGTCSLRVGDETKTVKLSPIVLSKLPPVGGTVGRVPFSLQVRQCDEGVKGAAFTFTGTADSSNANALANTGTARGVALYLRSADDNGVVPPSGTDRKRMASIVGSEGTLDLNAEYVVTSPNVAPGTVNSRVTFGISYQ